MDVYKFIDDQMQIGQDLMMIANPHQAIAHSLVVTWENGTARNSQ